MKKKLFTLAIFFVIFFCAETTYAQFYYCINDHLGNTRVIVDEQGNVKEYYDYYPFGKTLRSSITDEAVATYKFTGKELDEENDLNWYDFGPRPYDPEVGRFLCPDRLADKYPGISPYAYCFNNPLRFTDVTGDTVDVAPNLLKPVVYEEAEKKGQQKAVEDMTNEEKQIYAFQQWWENNKDKVNELFGIGGKYETTNIGFKLGIQPQKSFVLFGISCSNQQYQYRGRTAWGMHHTPETQFYTGTNRVNPTFGIDKLSINIYLNPNPYGGVLSSTPGHEWEHAILIFDRVKNNEVVPTGAEQHDLMKYRQVPILK